MAHGDDPPVQETHEVDSSTAQASQQAYESPAVLDLGSVRQVTRGSSSGGTADSNSDFFR